MKIVKRAAASVTL